MATLPEEEVMNSSTAAAALWLIGFERKDLEQNYVPFACRTEAA